MQGKAKVNFKFKVKEYRIIDRNLVKNRFNVKQFRIKINFAAIV